MQAVPFAAVLTIGLSLAGMAVAQPPAQPAAPAAASPARLGPQSTFAELLANPKSKALLYAEIPFVMNVLEKGLFPESRTLEIVAEDEQAQTIGGFTPEIYANILKQLATI